MFKTNIMSEFSGTVAQRVVHYAASQAIGGVVSFIIKLDEKFEGIPETLPVIATSGSHWKQLFCTNIQAGDKLLIKGKIQKIDLKIWQKEVYYLFANHIFNVTMDFGF